MAELEDSRRRLVTAADAERARLAQLLENGAQRRVSLLRGDLARVPVAASGDTAERIDQALAQLDRTQRDLQDLATGLDPVPDGDLAGALTSLADRTPVPVRLAVSGAPVGDEGTAVLWFVAAEATANAVKHARATRIDIDLVVDGGTARLTVADDGCGGADPAAGSGLRGLADRVDAVEGTLRVSSPSGSGTTVLVSVPSGTRPA